VAFRLIWSPTARLDLHDIAAYINDSVPAAARRFVQHVFDAVEQLVSFPNSGRVVPEFNDDQLREIIRPPCRIVYRVDSGQETIAVARIWHARRGIPRVP
jgi:plasmid stabilization system protein ParE